MKAPNIQPKYTRFVSYGLTPKKYKSQVFERRTKKSFRKWLRKKVRDEV